MRLPLIFAAVLAALPASAEVVNKSVGGMKARFDFADGLAGFNTIDTFLRLDAMETAEDYAAEKALGFRLTDRATRRDGRYVSVLRRTEADIGGAQPNIYVTAFAWDTATQDFIRLDHFFDPGAARDEALIAISHHLRTQIRQRIWGGKPAPAFLPLIEQATNPDAAVLSNFTMNGAAGLTFHYSPYEVAPYARGAIAVDVPTSVFSAWLNAQGREAFR